MTPRTAEQRAKACDFPVPTFKLRDSERSPSLIKIEDLAVYIDMPRGSQARLAFR
ncbi:pyocin activator PrtN family protein [Vibrio lentus]|nr:pyocin activator PrtN family protein [Vibrio lentus]